MFAPPPQDLMALQLWMEEQYEVEFEDEFSIDVRSAAPPPKEEWWAEA